MMVASADQTTAAFGGGGERFVERAGNLAQRASAKKGLLVEARASNTSAPGTPTSTPSAKELDFPLSNDSPKSPTSSSSSSILKQSPTTSSPGADNNVSPKIARAVVLSPTTIPPPHLPLKKKSANTLRLNLVPRGGTQRVEPSPPRSADRTPSNGVSPRLYPERKQSLPQPDRQQNLPPPERQQSLVSGGTTPREYEPWPDVGDAIVSPSVIWTRARGLTSASQTTPTIPSVTRELKQTSSIPDLAAYRANQRSMTTSAYRPERGPNNRDTGHSFRSPPPIPWKETEEVRASFRSALTNNGEVRSSFRSGYTNGSYVTYASSGFIDASETERSSVMTRASSLSDMFYKSKMQGMDDEGLTVEDTISLYAHGFTDDELERQLDQGIEDIKSFMPTPLPEPMVNQAGSQKDKPQPPLPKQEVAPLDSPIRTAVKYDHTFKDDLLEVKSPSPSQIQLPLSPLQANPVSSPMSSLPVLPQKEEQSELPKDTKPERTFSQRPQRPQRPIIDAFEPIPRDRYGFKKESQYVTVAQYDEWNHQYTEYLDRRRRKWIALMTQWGLAKENPIRFPPKSDKVKRYIRKGIPPDWRGAAWFWYAGGPSRIAQNPGQYKRLCNQAEIGFLSDTDREIIERDLNRTFPDNIKFKPDPIPETASDQNFPGRNVRPAGSRSTSRAVIETPILKALRRVLQAFAIHNPNIGYCQSLNFLAGMLLLFLNEDEEKTFHLLNIITSVHLPGTHAKVLEANVDVGVLMSCIKDSMPAVWAKIDDIDEGRGQISTNRLPTVSLATTAWFMSCFIGNLPTESVLRVWDSFFYEGSKTLFRVSLAIFKVGEWEIRNVNEHMEVFQVVQLIPRRLIDASALMESCFKRRNGFGHLSQETIDARRKERRSALQRDRDRKNGQRNPTLDDDFEVVVKTEPRENGLRRVASKARLRRNQSRKRYPPMQEAI